MVAVSFSTLFETPSIAFAISCIALQFLSHCHYVAMECLVTVTLRFGNEPSTEISISSSLYKDGSGASSHKEAWS